MLAVRRDAELSRRAERLELSINLLNEALDQIDLIGDCPELGAKLAEIIEGLKQQYTSLTA